MRLLAVLALAALPAIHSPEAAAQAPSTFRSNTELTLTGKDGLQRVTLPMEAYRDARPDLADVRVFNANGEAVPIAWAAAPDPQQETPPAVALPMFPVTKLQPAGTKGSEVSVHAADGTIVSIKGMSTQTMPPRAVAIPSTRAR
jgi:hypothetical protein